MKKLKLADTELIAAHNCLNCGASNDAASGVVDKHARNTLKPKPGDVTLCLYCGHVMMFDKNLSFRELTKEEQLHAATDQRLLAAKAALTIMIKARKIH